ncbi:hypothetical protein DJFAAGMI_01636 [Comamonas sp. PE63]|uniref:Uncharacterized protein n=1 Tax=Comamonas brasiliensis TaxID=1812482 RepID=A0ABS5LQX6_9BURK|nr:hypothetical protein [Comamonas sp. PE63]
MALTAGSDSPQGLPDRKFCRPRILQTGYGRISMTRICTATRPDCYRLATSDFLFGKQGS